MDGSPGTAVIADVHFIATEEGGRREGVRRGYRPNHNFGPPEHRSFYIGALDVAEGDVIAPGEMRRLRIIFLGGKGLHGNLVPGRTWRIQEGAKLVATARIVEVVPAGDGNPR